ncbi:MAG: dioxygenase [Chloroflexota bacterium]|nr:dioxygenase [Chloroflexota bacterium]
MKTLGDPPAGARDVRAAMDSTEKGGRSDGRRRPAVKTRGALLRAGLALAGPLLLAACGGAVAASGSRRPRAQSEGASDTPDTQEAPIAEGAAPAAPATPAEGVLAPTPACVDDDDVTPAQTEGPYFTRNSPQRISLLEPGTAGTRLLLTGRVLGTDCRPVSRALVDFWQADDRGAYDNAGYRFRGHQFTDDAGQYRLETVVPGLYPGRTRHIHVKVQAPNRPVLTTQLYFPDEARNARDSIFRPELLISMQAPGASTPGASTPGEGRLGSFDFVLTVA